jgi:hypothetical protein
MQSAAAFMRERRFLVISKALAGHTIVHCLQPVQARPFTTTRPGT